MPADDQDDATIYMVVVNHEEQYSIWPEGRELPLGWLADGTSGPKADCLAHIEKVWTDMRPLSLRKQMEEAAWAAQDAEASCEKLPGDEPAGDGLVQRLVTGSHPVEVTLRPERTASVFKTCIDQGYINIKFTGTEGGTELGVRLDPAATGFDQSILETRSGKIRLTGALTLNFERVRCVADIDLESFAGQGYLERITTSGDQLDAGTND